MSIPVWRRKLSSIQYLYNTYTLYTSIVQKCFNISSKYKKSFFPIMIKDCDEALRHGRTADRIFVGESKQLLNYRLYELDQMISCIDNISTHFYVFIETMRKHDGISLEDMKKYYQWENEIGNSCDVIIGMIVKLKESDKRRYYDNVKKKQNKIKDSGVKSEQ